MEDIFTYEHILISNHQTFKSLYYQLYPTLCIFCNRIIKDDSAAEDIVQDIFVNLLKQKKEEWSGIELKSFLYRSIKNRAIDYLRHQHILRESKDRVIETFQTIENEIIEEEVYRKIHLALQKLSPQTQKIILLFMDNKSNKEIADLLNISINTVKTTKLRAYSVLRKNINLIIQLYFHIPII